MPRSASGRATWQTLLADRLHSAAIHLLRRVRRVDDATGLSAARLSALSVVVFAGPIRISALASAEQVRTPTITPIVAALERDGLVTREPDASDARAALLRATPKGARVMAEGRARRVAALAAELDGLSAADRVALERAVEILERLRQRNSELRTQN
jgi:DNA-binding MarR family transcriptional regulator